MRLSESELSFVEETCEFYTDPRLAEELTRIRFDMGVRDKVTIDQVRKARYKMGITKECGRGKSSIKRDKDDGENWYPFRDSYRWD